MPFARKYDEADRELFIDLVKSGLSNREISEKLNISMNAVAGRKWRLSLCSPDKSPLLRQDSLRQEEKDRIAELRKGGVKITIIAKLIGRSKSAVERELRVAKLTGLVFAHRIPPRVGHKYEQPTPIPKKLPSRVINEVRYTGGKCEEMGEDGEDCGKPAIYNPFGKRTFYCLEHYCRFYNGKFTAENLGTALVDNP